MERNYRGNGNVKYVTFAYFTDVMYYYFVDFGF